MPSPEIGADHVLVALDLRRRPLGDLSPEQIVACPWLDVRVESAHVWGVRGTLTGLAERFDGTAEPVAFRPLVDLIGLAH